MAVTIAPKYSVQSSQSDNLDNACQAIEVALQELVNNGATSAKLDAVWAKHSNDTAMLAAVKVSISSGNRIV